MSDLSQSARLMTRLEEADAALRSAIDRDDKASALASAREELRLARELGEAERVIYGLFHTAWVLRYCFRDIGEALPMLEEAKRIADATQSDRLIWSATMNLADAALDKSEWVKAASLASMALTPTWDTDRPDLPFLLEIAAFAAAGAGAQTEARRLYASASQARTNDTFDPRSVRVIRERMDRLIAPARSSSGRHDGRPLPLDEAVALAVSLPDILRRVGDVTVRHLTSPTA